MTQMKSYIDIKGINYFEKWFSKLDAQAAAKVTVYLTRLENNNTSSIKTVGEGVFECKINYGPGYKVYFGNDGDKIIILLAGGSKKRQENDIKKVKLLWKEYKANKKE